MLKLWLIARKYSVKISVWVIGVITNSRDAKDKVPLSAFNKVVDSMTLIIITLIICLGSVMALGIIGLFISFIT